MQPTEDKQERVVTNNYQQNLHALLSANLDVNADEFNDWLLKKSPMEMGQMIDAIKLGNSDDLNDIMIRYKSEKFTELRQQAQNAQIQEAQNRAMREQMEEMNRRQIQAKAHAEGFQRQVDAYNAQVNNAISDYNRALREEQARHAQPVQTAGQNSLSGNQMTQAMKDYCSEPVGGARGMTAKQMETCFGVGGSDGSYSTSNPTPSVIANCDSSGCNGTDGTRYNSVGGGNYHGSDGRFCQNIGGQMQCH